MNAFRAFMELDNLYESYDDRQYYISRLKALGKNYYFDNFSDEQLYYILEKAEAEKRAKDDLKDLHRPKIEKPVCDSCGQELTDGGFCPNCDDGRDDLINEFLQETSETKSIYVCSECGYETELFDNEFDGCCPRCHDHHGAFGKCEEALNEATELSTEHAINSVVDQVKAIYEAGLFDKLPVGRKNAYTLEISGPDKERLTGYFAKQSEFTHEVNNDSGIISHEFISSEFDIEIFDTFISMYKIPQNESLKEWKLPDGSTCSNNASTAAASLPSTSPSQAPTTSPTTPPPPGSNIVTIVYDTAKNKLRAQADDGVHGIANVAFPNSLRNNPGQQYEVETLIWNGKNYRASGKIIPVSNVSSTQNINEFFNKENYEMNFQTILEELDKLYEPDLPEKALTEADDEEAFIEDEPLVDDETKVEEEPKQLILECSKCGGIVIKDEADVTVNEETDLANVDEACQYCEESEGYKIIGAVAPYETNENLEEGIFDRFKTIPYGKIKDTYNKVAVKAKDLKKGDLAYGSPINAKFADDFPLHYITKVKQNKDGTLDIHYHSSADISVDPDEEYCLFTPKQGINEGIFDRFKEIPYGKIKDTHNRTAVKAKDLKKGDLAEDASPNAKFQDDYPLRYITKIKQNKDGTLDIHYWSTAHLDVDPEEDYALFTPKSGK